MHTKDHYRADIVTSHHDITESKAWISLSPHQAHQDGPQDGAGGGREWGQTAGGSCAGLLHQSTNIIQFSQINKHNVTKLPKHFGLYFSSLTLILALHTAVHSSYFNIWLILTDQCAVQARHQLLAGQSGQQIVSNLLIRTKNRFGSGTVSFR